MRNELAVAAVVALRAAERTSLDITTLVVEPTGQNATIVAGFARGSTPVVLLGAICN